MLVFAPVGRDGALTRELLGRASIPALVCASIDDLCTEFANQAGAIIMTEEVLDESSFPRLVAALNRQPRVVRHRRHPLCRRDAALGRRSGRSEWSKRSAT